MDIDEASFQKELSESKEIIEDNLGEHIDFFSHPYAFPQADARYVNRFGEALLNLAIGQPSLPGWAAPVTVMTR